MVQILDPQVLVVGGGVIEAGDLLMGPTARVLPRAAGPARPAARSPSCVPPRLGNTAGVVGAADLARRR